MLWMRTMIRVQWTGQMCGAVGFRRMIQFLPFMILWVRITLSMAGAIDVAGMLRFRHHRVLLQMDFNVRNLPRDEIMVSHRIMLLSAWKLRELGHYEILAILISVSESCVRTGLLCVTALWASLHMYPTEERKVLLEPFLLLPSISLVRHP
uniref:Uncharacterized protein n=1 Tax=Arundo donax TaxID=35708 RepID=A0A0A9DHC6_ARUDO